MKMNNKGLSDVITNVLIIVLVIASVVILWTFLKPTIQQGAESTEAAQCLQVDLQAVSCTGISGNTADLTYKWTSGSGSVSGVKLVLGASDGTSVSIDGDVPDALTTIAEADAEFGTGKTPKEFSVAAVITTTSGNKINCPASQPVQCA